MSALGSGLRIQGHRTVDFTGLPSPKNLTKPGLYPWEGYGP